MWFKNYISAKKRFLISFEFSNIVINFPSHFIIVPYLDAGFWVSNSLDPDQARHFVRPDLSLNCLQMLSADDKICC